MQAAPACIGQLGPKECTERLLTGIGRSSQADLVVSERLEVVAMG